MAEIVLQGPLGIGNRCFVVDDVCQKLPGQILNAPLHQPFGVDQVLEVFDRPDQTVGHFGMRGF